MDYERSFKKLVEQIRVEMGFAKEAFKNEKSDEAKTNYNRGMLFAYESIEELASKLENGEFFNEEDLEA